MSEYDPSYLAEQNLYGSGREGHGSVPSMGMAASHHRHGSSAGTGGGWNRQRGPRRSGGNGWGGGGGGGGGRYYGGQRGSGYEQHPRDVYDGEEYNQRRLRDTLFRLGDATEGSSESFHPPSELFRLKEYIEHETIHSAKSYATVMSAFKIMATEQPHKIPLTAALLGFLVLSSSVRPDRPALAESTEAAEDQDMEVDRPLSNTGLQLVRDLLTTFRTDLDARHWRNVRLLLHLFASLIPLGIVQAASVRNVLNAFAAVLEEPGVAAARGDRAAICIIEVMSRAGRDLCLDIEGGVGETANQKLDELAERVERYATEYRHVEVSLVQPFAPRHGGVIEGEEDWLHEETFETTVSALQYLRAREYRKPAFLPSAVNLLPPPVVAAIKVPREDAITLPDILIPPDDEYAEGPGTSHSLSGADSSQGRRRQRKGKGASASPDDDLATYRAGAGVERVFRYPRWFKDTVPGVSSPDSVVLRSTIHDIIDLYQVNRKECSRILFDMPRWLRKGTFVGKSVTPDMGIFGEAEDAWQLGPDDKLQGSWSLDELIVESILSTSLVLPVPPQKPLYYTSLLREVVTVSPQSIAPAMGKSIRRIYGSLSSGRADVEAIRRFADWFSVHLSNFNFNWNWKEWIPDMDLPHAHPKLAFARRIVEIEIRLAYYERIRQTLPAEVQAKLLPEEPAPAFTYAAEDHPFRDRAMGLIQSMRARATAEVILADLQGFRREILPEEMASFVPSETEKIGFQARDESEAELAIRDVVIQAILSIGSRSFSHFLNVVERYHALLRQLSTAPAMRLAILSSTVRFWHKSPQWILIVADKWLQYRIIEPADVIDFVFAPPSDQPAIVTGTVDVAQQRDWSSFHWWELIKLTVHKVHGRVEQVRKRLESMQRAEMERLERLEAVREAGGPTDDVGQPDGVNGRTKQPLFPSGATVSTLPRRPDLPPLADEVVKPEPIAPTEPGSSEKKQSVDEVKTAYENIAQEQRKVLIRTLTGFLNRLESSPPGVWSRSGQEDNDEAIWQAWWSKGWYVEYCRLFNKDLMANHETIMANVFSASGRESAMRDVFERSCQMATE